MNLQELLMTDVMNGDAPGTSFGKIRTGECVTGSPFDTHADDKFKIALVYAQVHYLAVQHPDAEIEVQLVDDRTDILEHNRECFGAYPTFLPANCTLSYYRHLHGVLPADDISEPFATPISGTGIVHPHYPSIARGLMYSNRAFMGSDPILATTMARAVSLSKQFGGVGVEPQEFWPFALREKIRSLIANAASGNPVDFAPPSKPLPSVLPVLTLGVDGSVLSPVPSMVGAGGSVLASAPPMGGAGGSAAAFAFRSPDPTVVAGSPPPAPSSGGGFGAFLN